MLYWKKKEKKESENSYINFRQSFRRTQQRFPEVQEERERDEQVAQGALGGYDIILYDTVKWVHGIMHLSELTEPHSPK